MSGVKERENQGWFPDFDLSNWEDEATNYGERENCRRSFGKEYQKFGVDKINMKNVRLLHGTLKYAAGYMSLEFRGPVWGLDINLGIWCIDDA